MIQDEEFTRKIHAIHANHAETGAEERTMDIRHEEFAAMAEVYLGPSYDQDKLAEVERVQIRMQEGQNALATAFDTNSLTAEQYVDACNQLLQDSTLICERILGPDHFKMLFGVDANEAVGIIDKETFMAAHGRAQRKDYSYSYTIHPKQVYD